MTQKQEEDLEQKPTKRCSRCGLYKLRSEYSPYRWQHTGHCRQCVAEGYQSYKAKASKKPRPAQVNVALTTETLPDPAARSTLRQLDIQKLFAATGKDSKEVAALLTKILDIQNEQFKMLSELLLKGLGS